MRFFLRALLIAVGSFVGLTQTPAFDEQGRLLTTHVSSAQASGLCANDSCGDPNFGSNLNPNKEMGGSDGGCPKSNSVGNPINYATGNKYQVETDYVCAGVFPINISRYYNSLDSDPVHEFGLKWRGSYSRALVPFGATIFARRDNGAIYTFRLVNNVWTADADVNVKLGATATGWAYTNSFDEIEAYDANGRLLSITNRAGLSQTLAYDAAGRLLSVTDPVGRIVTFAYVSPSSPLVASVTGPDGRSFRYGYDSSNRLVSVTNPENRIRRYVYENATYPNLLTGIIDENNNRFSTFVYDANQRATNTSHAGGADLYSVDYAKIATGIVVVTGPLGGLTKHGMKGLNGSAVENVYLRDCGTNCAGSVYGATKLYDTNGNIIQARDEGGNQTDYVYDLTRNLETSRTEASGTPNARVISTSWHPTYRLPVRVVDGDRTRTYSYDARGNLLSVTITAPTANSTWRYTYNSFGQVLTAAEPLGRVTRYAYDARANLISVTNALNQVIRITSYDANGRPLSITDPNGLVTRLTYNFRGQITSRTTGQRVTTYNYDPAGSLVRVTRPDGSFLRAFYDAAHRLIRINDAVGNYVVYTRDAAGNRIKEDVYDATNVLRKTHRWTFDSFGRPATDVGAAGQTSSYSSDSNDLLTQFVDPNSNNKTIQYDAQKRVSSFSNSVGTVRLTYDDYSNISTVTDENGRDTLYDHNDLDQLRTVWSPDTDLSHRIFDAAGNATLAFDGRGVTQSRTYDALNRLTRIAYSGGDVTTYQYDVGANGVGRMTAMTDSSGSTTWTYDAFGSVTQKAQKIGAVTLTTRWSYDTVTGRLVSMTYPSGAILGFTYDAAGRVTAITETPPGGSPITLASQISYFPFGPVTSWTAGNGAIYTRTYDRDGRVSRVLFPNNRGMIFTYDQGGRIVNIKESGVLEKSFSYDQSDRLSYYANANITQTYSHDAVGNRLQLSVSTPSASQTFTYNYSAMSNQLRSLSGSATENWSYDAVGNVVGDVTPTTTKSFAYNAANRQRSAKVGSFTMAYRVDALGQRVAKVHGATGQFMFLAQFDLEGHVLGQYNGAGGLTQETVWLGDLPISVITPTGPLYVGPDQIGAPHEITDASKTRIWFWDHDPFGNGVPSGSYAYDLRFPGQLYDAETRNYYNFHRDYDPRIGRYIESDPIGLAGGTNTYAYVAGNPISRTDPLGLIAPWDILDAAMFAQSALNFSNCQSTENAINLAVDTIGLLPLIPSLGMLRRLDGALDAVKGVGEASSLANAARLRGQLAGKEIAGGHAFEKHVLNQGEFKGLDIRTREQFANHIENVVNNPTASRQLSGGRAAYWQDSTGTVVIRDPRAADGGTAFQPTNGRAYFDGLR